jgi:hypothetical protein
MACHLHLHVKLLTIKGKFAQPPLCAKLGILNEAMSASGAFDHSLRTTASAGAAGGYHY